MAQQLENENILESAYVSLHPESPEALKSAPQKDADAPPANVLTAGTPTDPLWDVPSVPSSFLLWVDVNMSIKLKTKDHPEGEWVTLLCDDEPSPDPSNGLYYFWAWWKSSWKHDKKVLADKGIEIRKQEYSWHAPCAIAIPYDSVVQDLYHPR